MKRERKAGTSAAARGSKFKPMPLAKEAWAELRQNLSIAIRDLDEDEHLILMAKGEDYFVQFADQGAHGMRAEAVSNTFIKRGAPLSENACQALVRMGWSPPTYTPSKTAEEPADGSPNFYIDAATPVPYARLASLAVTTLRQIYRVRHPGALEYTAFSDESTSIRFPLLKVKRESKSVDPIRVEVKDPAPPSETDSPPALTGRLQERLFKQIEKIRAVLPAGFILTRLEDGTTAHIVGPDFDLVYYPSVEKIKYRDQWRSMRGQTVVKWMKSLTRNHQ